MKYEIITYSRSTGDITHSKRLYSTRWNAEAALRTKAMRIDSLWKTYFLDFPDDSDALIIYGKFLRRIGRRDSAYDAFKRAAALAPDAAVAYQQMSALEAESGMSAEAFAHIRAALKIRHDRAESNAFKSQRGFKSLYLEIAVALIVELA